MIIDVKTVTPLSCVRYDAYGTVYINLFGVEGFALVRELLDLSLAVALRLVHVMEGLKFTSHGLLVLPGGELSPSYAT